jgi:two-component system sensor histidine kinase RegB
MRQNVAPALMPQRQRFATLPADGTLRRLVLLRYGAISVALVLALASEDWWGIALPARELIVVLVLLLLINLATALRLRAVWPVTTLELFAQLLVDVLALTLVLYLTGGWTNPFVSLYLLPIVLGAITLPAGMTWLLAAAALAAYTLLVYRYVPLADPHAGHAGHSGAFELHTWGMWANFVLSAGIIAALVGRMSASLRRRDAALARAREDALRDERLVALGTLAAGTAHELATPLSTVAMLAGELRAGHRRPEELDESLALIEQQTALCTRALSRLNRAAGNAPAEAPRTLCLRDLVAEIAESFRLTHPQTRLQLEWTREGEEGPRIRQEPTLDQAVLTLLDNAARAATRQVVLRCNWDASRLHLQVLDDGPGLTAEAMERAPEAYYTSRPGKGLGLGVYLANATVERLGGEIALSNREAGGARVELSVPLAALAADEI